MEAKEKTERFAKEKGDSKENIPYKKGKRWAEDEASGLERKRKGIPLREQKRLARDDVRTDKEQKAR